MSEDVTTSGPLFDGRAQAALDRGIEEVRKRVAAEGQRLTVAAFSSAIRRDSGRFLSEISTTRGGKAVSTASGRNVYTMVLDGDPATDDLVYPDNAAYGPWLDGTGSRNETTRFKGYHGFRLAAQALDRAAGPIAAETLVPYVAEMNA